MAFRDSWHRALVYFGLAEERDPYDEEEPTYEPEAELEDRYRERPNVRRLGSTRRRRDDFVARCPARVVGLMTMPPLAAEPEDSRPWFAALAELAAARGLRHLSMGTSQDYLVAVQEGATIVRLGTTLYR